MILHLPTFARAVVLLLALSAFAPAQEPGFFSSGVVDNAPPSGFTTAPILDDTTSSAVNAAAVLTTAPPPAAIQVRMELQGPEALAVLGNFPIKYIFTEFNTLGADRRTKAVADAALASGMSAGAFVGNFNLYPNLRNDPTRPAGQVASITGIDYSAARGKVGAQLGNQFAAPALFPGSADFRNPAQGNSGAPNIRSALFVLPIQRLTLAELGLRGFADPPTGAAAYAIPASPHDPAQRLIPWVMRFNNLDNPALGGGPTGTGFVQNSATPSNGQLLSRGDFQALVLHYRLRGADDLILMDRSTSVVGYSPAQARSDVVTGWTANVADDIIARQNYAFANLTNTIGDSVDANNLPVERSTELAGAVWSGVYDRAGSADPDGQRKMAILISNLSSVQKIIDLPNIGGFAVDHPVAGPDPRPAAFAVNAGAHRTLLFTLAPDSNNVTKWILSKDIFIGLDNNRNGVGLQVPFPALSIDVAADSDVCVNSMGNTASVTSPAANATYHWAIQGGIIQTGQGTPTITYSVGVSGTAVVALTAISVDAQMVETVYEGAAVVRIGPPSDITVAPFAVAFSQGNFAGGPAGTGLQYDWSISGPGVLLTPPDQRIVEFRAGASGTLTLSLTVTVAATGCSSTSTADVVIDQPPVATNDRAFTTANRPVDIQVLANDTDPNAGDMLTVSIASQPAFGTVMVINNGTAIRYTPNGAVQNDSFTYRVTDARGASAVGTVTIQDTLAVSIGDYRGLAMSAAGTPSENARRGSARVLVSRNGAFSGYLTLAGVRRAFSGTFDASGAAQFKPALTPTFPFQRRAGETPLALSLHLVADNDPDQISGTLTDNGAPFADLEIVRTVTAFIPSRYTFLYVAQAAPNRTVPLEEFPQGTGYATNSVSNRGLAILRGRLADFGAVIFADTLTSTPAKGTRLPFYQSLYGGGGSISGWINFRNIAGNSDADAPDLDWFRPPQPAQPLYKMGWPGGIGIKLRGSKFSNRTPLSSLPGLGPVDQDGNAELMLRSGGFPDTGVFDALNITPANRVAKVGANPRRLRSFLLTANGGFNVYFRVPGESVDRLLRGVVFQKTNFLAGFYLGQNGSGLGTVTPVDTPAQSP